MAGNEGDVVSDQGGWQWSELWKTEDWWAIWLGFAVLIAGMALYFPMKGRIEGNLKKIESKYKAEARTEPFRSIAWFHMKDKKKGQQALKSKQGKFMKKFSKKPHKWKTNPLQAFYMSDAAATKKAQKSAAKFATMKEKGKLALEAAVTAETAAKEASFKDASLNKAAQAAILSWRGIVTAKKYKKTKKKAKMKNGVKHGYNQVGWLLGLGLAFGIFFGIGTAAMGRSLPQFLVGFAFVYALAVLAFLASYQANVKASGIGYAAWSILFGLIISNTVGTPKWAVPAVQTEFYIKTGLVLLGAKILFEKILTIGTAGIFVAWVVTPIVLLTTYWFGQKIVKMPSKRLNITISADMSVCGVSAAIATASACRAKKEELTLAVGLSLVFTAIMMVVMPAIIKNVFPGIFTGIYAKYGTEGIMVLGGAWMGGTIDATGAVAAAGAFLGENALYVAATVKMIQNVLIGVIAFFVAIYFTSKVEAQETGIKVGPMEIWYRFPKFVLGFIAASVIFSAFWSSFNGDVKGLGFSLVDKGTIKGMSDLFRGWFFCLSFVSIGLATNFRELKEYFKGGKPLILYLFGQSFNLILTLTMAYIMFFRVFESLTADLLK